MDGSTASRLDPTGETRRYLAYTEVALRPRDRLLVAGILRPETAEDLAADATVDPMLPHDARLVLERTDPDVVLIESAALSPGGPWGHAGEPSVADLAERLFGVLTVAQEMDRPSVIWWNTPRSATPGLLPLEAHASLVIRDETFADDDAVAPWTPGVRLSRFNSIALDPSRPMSPVYAGAWAPADPRSVRAFTSMALESLVDAGLDVWLDDESDPGWLPPNLRSRVSARSGSTSTAERYRSRGLFLAAPMTTAARTTVAPRSLQQLASGARLVSGPNHALAATIDDGVSWLEDPADAPRAVNEAIERGPLDAAERRRLLRVLYRRHATSVALANLASYLGVRGRRFASRDACVLADLRGGVQAETVVDGILAQVLRPTEAVLICDDMNDLRAALAELESSGILARAVSADAIRGQALNAVARGTDAGWLWYWSRERWLEPTLLLDLMAGAAVSRADAVGWVGGGDDRFVADLPLGNAIVSRSAAIARAEPSGGSLGSWAARGGVLFGLAEGTDQGPVAT